MAIQIQRFAFLVMRFERLNGSMDQRLNGSMAKQILPKLDAFTPPNANTPGAVPPSYFALSERFRVV